MTEQLYRYRVFARLDDGTWAQLGEAEGRTGNHATDVLLEDSGFEPPERVVLSRGVEFMAVPVTRIHITYKQLRVQAQLLTLDGLPAQPEEQVAALAEEALASSEEHAVTVRPGFPTAPDDGTVVPMPDREPS